MRAEPIYYRGRLAAVLVKCPYDQNFKVKRIPGCRWNKSRKGWRLPLKVEVLSRLRREFPDIDIAQEFYDWYEERERFREQIHQLKSRGDAELPLPKLYPYQRVGVQFLQLTKRALLADDMGLGKTVQALKACEVRGDERVLVVCPNSLKANWEEEVSKWTEYAPTVVRGDPEQRQHILDGFEAGALITNYALLRIDKKPTSDLSRLLKMDIGTLVLDEAHSIKNRKAQRTKGIHKLARGIPHLIELTGTPINNRVPELWSLLHAIDPVQYSSYWDFVKQHANARPGRFGWLVEDHATDPQALATEIETRVLRREKSEVRKDLPSITYTNRVVEMEEKQFRLYTDMQQDMITELSDGEQLVAPVVLSQITRLRQIAVSPRLVGDTELGSKIKALADIVEGTNQKVLIFSQFAEAIKLVAEHVDCEYIIGEVKEEERSEIINRFQQDAQPRVLACTMQTGGVGVNLTAASLVIFLDKHWTPAINQQAIDRAYRHGQQNPVTVVSLLARDTVEEWIEDILKEKKNIHDEIIGYVKNLKGAIK